MRFKTYLERIKITPEIFENIRKIRFCLDCFQPVLTGIDKNQLVVPDYEERRVSQEQMESQNHVDQRYYEESIFLSQNSDKIVSESDPEDCFKIKLSDNVDKTGRTEDKEDIGQGTEKVFYDKWTREGQWDSQEEGINQKTLKDNRCHFPNQLDSEKFGDLGDNMETVKKKADYGMEWEMNRESNDFVQEMKLSDCQNKIDHIRRDADEFLLMDEIKNNNDNWIDEEIQNEMETKSLNEEVQNLKEETIPKTEFDILKGYLNDIKNENLAK
jgi:hypothetical protein